MSVDEGSGSGERREMRKDKQQVIKEEEEEDFSFRFSSRNTSSKYDFVKVKVWLGDNADHYYVLSRFLLSRMLTVTKVLSFSLSSQ